MASLTAPTVRVRDIEFGVRPVRLRLPFRFGALSLRACPQVFVRAAVEVEGRAPVWGHAAELAVPRWFDKRPDRNLQANVQDLIDALQLAADAYCSVGALPAAALSLRLLPELANEGRRRGWTALSAAYGGAMLDRAVLDALCRALGLSVFHAVRHDLVGLSHSDVPDDLAGWGWHAWLADLRPLQRLQVRHTVGLLDDLGSRSDATDGHPDSLRSAIRQQGLRVFKVKLGGDPVADLDRLAAVIDVLHGAAPDFRFTVDGNEQYAGPGALAALFDGLQRLPEIDRLLYIEQPLPRERSQAGPLPAGAPAPLLLDEADDALDAFVHARQAGWTGVSSKLCKGLYKALLNRARCDRWNADGTGPRCFMSAEDLTCQAGIAVQQDLAWAALLGLAHCERNGHHYADGFGDAPADEQAAFAAAHPDLYETAAGRPRLHIAAGRIEIGSLFGTGFAHGADPDFRFMQPLQDASALVAADGSP
jgi:L-alanine-DL-glutamate epimerase-like enolase superfamily enzyme